MARGRMIAGNWKMNGLQAQRDEARAVAAFVGDNVSANAAVEVVICPPFTLLSDVARDVAGTPVHVGAQDCHIADTGAHTGDVCASMLADAGASHVIIAHSERRALGETDVLAAQKVRAAAQYDVTPIICVGETEAQRDAGEAEAVVAAQIRGSLPDVSAVGHAIAARACLAYEPVWAIGTGRTPSVDDIAAMHAASRTVLAEVWGAERAESMRILYGGSVKPGNARAILDVDGVDGALVGGASLTAESFTQIIQSAI